MKFDRRIILITMLIFSGLCSCYAEKMGIKDFYCIVNGEKIFLGDSLKEHIGICDLKKYSVQKIGGIEFKVYDTGWGQIYVSGYSEDYRIFGIAVKGVDVKIINDIKVGMKKKRVLELMETADRIINNEFYYYNDDFDVLELKISFDKKNEISEIRMFLGT